MHRKNGPDKTFYFKQFHIHHDRSAMKVGTDGVLLGSWANPSNAKYILDIGSGTGLIALMMAQQSPEHAIIDGIEVDKDSFEEAIQNMSESPWKNKVHFWNMPVQQFKPDRMYDLIVCNPPFFEDSLVPPDPRRGGSRHKLSLSFEELVVAVKRLLATDGTLCVILPDTSAARFIHLSAVSSLFCSRQLTVKSKKSKPAVRVLLQFSRVSLNRTLDELHLMDDDGNWTAAYKKLVAPFYLWA